MIVETVLLDAAEFAVQYELLRSQIIGTAGNVARGIRLSQPRGVGLALLLSEGLPGWLQTVETVLLASLGPLAVESADPSRHQDPPWYRAVPGWLSSVQLHEITTLLASLVLSTRPVGSVAHESSREGYRGWS